MSADSLLTKKFLDDEIAARVFYDTRLAAYSGQPLSGGVPDSAPPAYTSLIDLTQSLNLVNGISHLDATKNTALSVINQEGAYTGSNPNVFWLYRSYNQNSLYMSGRTMILNLNMRSTGVYLTNVTASYSYVSVIGASYLSFDGLNLSYDYVYIP